MTENKKNVTMRKTKNGWLVSGGKDPTGRKWPDYITKQKWKAEIVKEAHQGLRRNPPTSPRSGGKGTIHVRSHARKRTKGVRAHTRKQ